MEKLISKVYFIIIIYAFWNGWNQWVAVTDGLASSNQSLEALKRKVSKLKRERKQVTKFLQDIKKAKEKIAIVEEEVKAIQKRLPEKIDDAENLGRLKSLAENLNLKNIFLAPGRETNKGFYFTKKYDFTATGTYLQFLLLLEKISTSDRLYNVADINISKSTESVRGRYQTVTGKLSIESFRYNLEYEKKKVTKKSVSKNKKRKKRRRGKKK